MEKLEHMAFSSAHLDRDEPWMLTGGGIEDRAVEWVKQEA
jgi:hypothetical protein